MYVLTTLLKKTFTTCQFWDRFQHSNFLKYWLVGCRYSITRYVSTTNIYVTARIYAICEDSEIPRYLTYLIFGARSSNFFNSSSAKRSLVWLHVLVLEMLSKMLPKCLMLAILPSQQISKKCLLNLLIQVYLDNKALFS